MLKLYSEVDEVIQANIPFDNCLNVSRLPSIATVMSNTSRLFGYANDRSDVTSLLITSVTLT